MPLSNAGLKRRINASVRKPIMVRAVRPNAGVGAAYRRRLEALIDEMNASIGFWLKGAYRAQESAIVAQDENPIAILQRAFVNLARRWQRKFDDLAPKVAKHFANAARSSTESSFKLALKDAGFAVEFRLTDHARNALNAVIEENVGLIRSIAAEHLTDVQGILMRSASTGRDLGYMAKELEHRFDVTKRRAAFISMDQNSKATAVIVRSRQMELNLHKAIWLHSTIAEQARPKHKAANGTEYDVRVGLPIGDKGEMTWPGVCINCRCVSRTIIDPFDKED